MPGVWHVDPGNDGPGVGMTEYAGKAIVKLFDAIHAALPGANNAGIVGDSAHDAGYHRGRNYVGSGDYSVQLAADQKGSGEAACGLDLTWDSAQLQYDMSRRLMQAKNDPRMYPVRSFFGSEDGVNVCGWDYAGDYPVTSDPSHLWHIHVSILREFADDWTALAPVADVITGKTTTTTEGDDVPERTRVRRTTELALTPDKEVEVMWDKQDYDTGSAFYGDDAPTGGETNGRIMTGSKEAGSPYVSTAALTVRGLPEGANLFTSLLYCLPDGSPDGGASWEEHTGNGGDLSIVDTRANYSDKQRGIKVRIKTGSSGVVVKSGAVWSVLYWR